MQLRKFFDKKWKVVVAVILGLAFLGALVREDEPKEAKVEAEDSVGVKDTDEEVEEVVEEKREPANFDEQVLFAVEEVAGKDTNTDKPKVREITINDNMGTDIEGDKVVMISLNPNDNLTLKMMRKGMLMESTDIYEKLSEFPEATDISISYFGTTVNEYGEESDSLIMKTNLLREGLDRINWDNFNSDSLPDISESYLEHPDLRE